jgi:hypothetical protein
MERLSYIVAGAVLLAVPVLAAGLAHAAGHLAAARWLGRLPELQLGTGWRLAARGRVSIALPLPLVWVSLPEERDLTWPSLLLFRAAGALANLLGAAALALTTALVLDPSSGAVGGAIDLIDDSARSLINLFVPASSPTALADAPVATVGGPPGRDGRAAFVLMIGHICVSLQLGVAGYNLLPLPFSDALRLLERLLSRRLQEASWLVLVAIWLWTVVVDLSGLFGTP